MEKITANVRRLTVTAQPSGTTLVRSLKISHRHSPFSFQFDGVDLFYWIDQNGSNHSYREIGNTTICDKKEPTLLEEVAEVSNKEMLPISGFSYGSISYENQELNVKIGD